MKNPDDVGNRTICDVDFLVKQSSEIVSLILMSL